MNDDIDKSVDNLVDTLESLLRTELSKYPVKAHEPESPLL